MSHVSHRISDGPLHGKAATLGFSALFTVIAVLGLVFGPGCGRTARTPSRTPDSLSLQRNVFKPYDSLRAIVDSVHQDLNGDGIPEFVLSSRDVTEPENPVFPRQFDRIEVFSLDTASQRYSSIFIDPVESGQKFVFRDLTGDGRPEIVLRTNSGGNDPVVSEGMTVYGTRHDGVLSTLFFSQSGSPELRDLNGDNIPEVIVTGQYWGSMTHADAIAYTNAIYAYDGSVFTESNTVFGAYFDRIIGRKKTDYTKLKATRVKDAADHAHALFRAFADWIIWIAAKGDAQQATRLWEAEKQFLRTKLSPEQWDDLESLSLDVESLEPMVNAPNG